MTVAVLSPDLLISTRITDAAGRAGAPSVRVDRPDRLPDPSVVRLLLVDWAAREATWAEELRNWCLGAPESARPRIILFGPHTDLAAHSAARDSGLGPMLARSKLVADLPGLVRIGADSG